MPESTYHLQSLALAMVFVSGVTVLCLAPALLRFAGDFRDSMRAWIVGTVCVVSTDVLFFLGVELPYKGTVLTLIASLGVAEWIHALRLYNGHTRRVWWPWLVVAVGTVLSLPASSYPASVAVTSIVFAVLYFGAAVHAAGIREPARSMGRALLVSIFVLIAVTMVGRLVLVATGVRSGAPPGFTSPLRALMFVIASMGPVAASLAFVLACGERLGDRLLRWSLIDSLTEIPNRRSFLESLDRVLSAGRRRKEPVGVLVVDLDNLKKINDTAGHAAGDRALIEVAKLLVGASRSEDVVGRLGGDEFAMVVPGADLEAATATAERLRERIAGSPVSIAGRSIELTVSIGVAISTAEDESARELIGRADVVLYEAKGRGRDRVVTSTESGSISANDLEPVP